MGKNLKLAAYSILTISILAGIVYNIFSSTVGSSDNVSLSNIFVLDILKNTSSSRSSSWPSIFEHNIVRAFLNGLLSVVSVGLFSVPFVFNSVNLWADVLRNPAGGGVLVYSFVISEALGVIGIVYTTISFGYDILFEKKFNFKKHTPLIIICIGLLMIGAIFEQYAIK